MAAAVAVELRMNAAYLFDDVADGDVDRRGGLPAAEALAVAIALQTCSSASAAEATAALGAADRDRALSGFHRDYNLACGGQLRDARLEQQSEATIAEALAMTAGKSGGFGRMAAAFGASIAGASEVAVERFRSFGLHLFTLAQLADDIRDARPSRSPSSDFARHKKTVPLVYFAHHPGASGTKMSRRRFERSGALLGGAILAEVFAGRARRDLATLTASGYAVEALERVLSQAESDLYDVVAASRADAGAGQVARTRVRGRDSSVHRGRRPRDVGAGELLDSLPTV